MLKSSFKNPRIPEFLFLRPASIPVEKLLLAARRIVQGGVYPYYSAMRVF